MNVGGPDPDEDEGGIPQRPPRSNNRILSTPPPVDEPDEEADAGFHNERQNTPSNSRASYVTSPSTEKRKRMEDLAERRRLKKRL